MKHKEYQHEEAKPKDAPMGKGPSDMYSAPGLEAWNKEMMTISYGKYGEKGCAHDRSRIAPYMMYNDNKDQNGY